MTDPFLNLTPEDLGRMCKGNVKMLPTFAVHETGWPHGVSRPDKHNRIHISGPAFQRSVVGNWPMRAGLWLNMGLREYHIDLEPHHLQGGADQQVEIKGNATARAVTGTDAGGRQPDEEDYETPIVERSESRKVERADLERIEANPEKRGVASDALSGGDTERGLAMGDHD